MLLNRRLGLFVFGEPTHDRDDLSPAQRALPDRARIEALIVPAGCGIILKVVLPGTRKIENTFSPSSADKKTVKIK